MVLGKNCTFFAQLSHSSQTDLPIEGKAVQVVYSPKQEVLREEVLVIIEQKIALYRFTHLGAF